MDGDVKGTAATPRRVIARGLDFERLRTAIEDRVGADRLSALLAEELPAAREFDRLPEFLDAVFFSKGDLRAFAPARPDLWYQALLRTAAHLAGERNEGAIRRAGPEADMLGTKGPNQLPPDGKRWSVLQLVNWLLLGTVQARKPLAAVVTMRDEGPSIVEWVAHYLALGFEGLYVYSNDNDDGSELLLRALADNGAIVYIDNPVGEGVNPQVKAYEHSLHLVPDLREHEWVFYLDADELFIPGPLFDRSMARIVAALAARPEVVSVCYNWHWFFSNYAFKRTPGLLLERFQHSRNAGQIKSLVRPRHVLSMRSVHLPRFPGAHGIFVDSSLTPVDSSNANKLYFGAEGGQINHYWCRSFEEYAVKKARGERMKLDIEDPSFKRDYASFFRTNDRETPQSFDPPPASLIAGVRAEMARLRTLPGVSEAEARVIRANEALVARYTVEQDLQAVYERLAAARKAENPR